MFVLGGFFARGFGKNGRLRQWFLVGGFVFGFPVFSIAWNGAGESEVGWFVVGFPCFVIAWNGAGGGEECRRL